MAILLEVSGNSDSDLTPRTFKSCEQFDTSGWEFLLLTCIVVSNLNSHYLLKPSYSKLYNMGKWAVGGCAVDAVSSGPLYSFRQMCPWVMSFLFGSVSRESRRPCPCASQICDPTPSARSNRDRRTRSLLLPLISCQSDGYWINPHVRFVFRLTAPRMGT